MITAAVTMVRDEADIIGSTLRHMLDEVDYILVADNRSADLTREIVRGVMREYPGRVEVLDDDEPAYLQSAKMTHLAHLAHEKWGADWIVPFDADEWWYSPFGRLGDQLAELAPQWLAAEAELYDHVATGEDPAIADPVRRIGWRQRTPAALPKVAVRWRADLVIEQGNHAATYCGGTTVWPAGLLVVRHFPYRSVDQLVRKVRNGADAYRAAGEQLPADMGAHWRQWGEILDRDGPEALAEIFRGWYWRAAPRARHKLPDGTVAGSLIFDPPPGLPPG